MSKKVTFPSIQEFKNYVYERIQLENPEIKRKDVNIICKEFADAMRDFFLEKERFRIPSFGTFEIIHSKPKVGRNPLTGERMEIPRHGKVKFSPSNSLKDDVWYLKEQE